MRNTRLLFLLVIAVLLCNTPASTASAAADQPISATQVDEGYSLAGDWKFRWGDDVRWAAATFDDSQWSVDPVPRRWAKGGIPILEEFSWYRLTLKLDETVLEALGPRGRIGLQIGKILSAYEVYAGGMLLGGVGKLPPNSEVNYDQMRVYVVPPAAISDDGTLVLALRVWGGTDLSISTWGGGPHEGKFRIGYYENVLYASYIDELPVLIMAILFTGFGIYHIYLFSRNRQLLVYLWYGLVALDVGLYSFMSGQLRYILNWPHATYEKLEFGAIYLLPALVVQMLSTLIDQPINRFWRAYQLIFIGFTAVTLLTPGLEVLNYTMLPWEMMCLPLLVWIPWVVIRSARAGNAEARTTMVGLTIFIITCANDLMIDIAGWGTIRLLPLGFIAIMVSMAVSLANRFTVMLDDLEHEVAQQTASLLSANEKLAALARQDPLTGLLNRRGLLEMAEGEQHRWARTEREFSIILADLDNFKRLNDEHGHACGDHVLQEVAQLLKVRVRDMDSLARWGGEEFILVMPETGTEGAALLGEALRASVAAHQFRFGDCTLTVRMTLGVATFRAGDTLEACIARADRALYTGKAQGRNRVEVSS